MRLPALAALFVLAGIGTAVADTKIDLTYISVMDMVRPEVHPNIVVHHNLHVTIAGQGNLAEHRHRSTKQYADRNAMAQVLSSPATLAVSRSSTS